MPSFLSMKEKRVLSGPHVSLEIVRELRALADEFERGDVIASRFEYNRCGRLRLVLRGLWKQE